MNNAELITELTYCANIEKRKLLSDAADALEAADKRIADLETALVDAVPVVRCGECRWWSKDEPDDECGYCYNGKIIGSTKENWHCADGKRKNGERRTE